MMKQMVAVGLHVLAAVCCYRKRLCDSPQEDPDYQNLPEERPGGFNWGEGRRLADDGGPPNNDL